MEATVEVSPALPSPSVPSGTRGARPGPMARHERLGGMGASVADIEGQTREGGEYGSAGGAPSVGGALSYPQCMAISRCAFCGPAMRSTDRRFRRGGLLSRSVVRAGAVYITYLLRRSSTLDARTGYTL